MSKALSRSRFLNMVLLALPLLSACLGKRPGFENPTVTLKSLRAG